MQKNTPELTVQMLSATDVLKETLKDNLLAICLHGSAVSGKLRPQSDIDLLAIISHPLTEAQRKQLLTALMRISGPHPAKSPQHRCLEVIVFLQADLTQLQFPARAEFIYGEWLRDGFESGEPSVPTSDPEYTLILAQARQEAIALWGDAPSELLPEVSSEHIHDAMRLALPALMDGLHGDERNVLLTLARMWRTAKTGDFVTKDSAAEWALPLLNAPYTETLDYARRAYLGEEADFWNDHQRAAGLLAVQLHKHVSDLLCE